VGSADCSPPLSDTHHHRPYVRKVSSQKPLMTYCSVALKTVMKCGTISISRMHSHTALSHWSYQSNFRGLLTITFTFNTRIPHKLIDKLAISHFKVFMDYGLPHSQTTTWSNWQPHIILNPYHEHMCTAGLGALSSPLQTLTLTLTLTLAASLFTLTAHVVWRPVN
jgi:hypothetical protein